MNICEGLVKMSEFNGQIDDEILEQQFPDKLLRGESIMVLVDYDLFGQNVRDHVGVYLKEDENTKKCLIYFPKNQEWGELRRADFQRLSPGEVTTENLDFISRIKTMVCTFEA